MKAYYEKTVGEWAIDLEFSPWTPKRYVYRINGTAQYYATEEEANAQIKLLEAGGEQARILKYSEPVSDAPKRGRPRGG